MVDAAFAIVRSGTVARPPSGRYRSMGENVRRSGRIRRDDASRIGGERVVSAPRCAVVAAAGGSRDLLDVRAAAAQALRLARFRARRCVVRSWRRSPGVRRRRVRARRWARIRRSCSWMPGFDFGLLLDPLSLLWTFIITGVGFLILFYSIGYMAGRPRLRAILRLHELLRLRDAHARALRQLRRDCSSAGASSAWRRTS